jgi:hypothetical protein
MDVLFAAASVALIALALRDVFETMVVPRRVPRNFRFTPLFYRTSWAIWAAVGRRIPPGRRREAFLSVFGPLSMLALFATWAFSLILGIGLLQWSLGTPLRGEGATLSSYLYLSGSTFFTLGYGDVAPASALGRALAVAESGLGFGFMAVVIGYLPVLYQAFSRRELTISLLDARAGSPPSAAQLLLRQARAGDPGAITALLAEWERWAAELLESHLSYPVLSYYRSQHDNQSWLAALTAILDACAFLLAGGTAYTYQAQLTFAMARHAAVDLALIFRTAPRAPAEDRLPPDRLAQLRSGLRKAGHELRDGPAVDAKLAELRGLYEGFVNALAGYFLFPLPDVVPGAPRPDNWQTTPWTRRGPSLDRLSASEVDVGTHFD